MPSFPSLYTVRSGLFAQRRALEVVGQNVANASTVGYTRQETSFATTDPNQVIKAGGRGISEVAVMRYREDFLDRQYRNRAGVLGYQDTRNGSLARVEEIIGDLSEGGLRTALDDLFNAWEILNLRPADTGARVGIVQAAEEFLALARSSYAELAGLRTSLDESLRHKVADVNAASAQIAELNRALLGGEVNQQQANELLDRRDKLIDALAKMTGATSTRQPDGSVTVHLGALQLVDKSFSFPLDISVGLEADRDPDPDIVSVRQHLATLTWNGTGIEAKFHAGEMAGLLEVRDQAIPNFMKYLDHLVRTVAQAVNDAHNEGVPADQEINIFEIGQDWVAVRVNPALLADPSLIRAGLGAVDGDGVWSAMPGDGERALAIARLRSAPLLTGDPIGSRTVTAGEYLRSISTLLGMQVQQTERRTDAAALQLEQADKQRQSVAGVSLDDEMTKMIQFQQAYNAAARLMTAIDEMLDVVINRVGVVGR